MFHSEDRIDTFAWVMSFGEIANIAQVNQKPLNGL
jgi:hypothetical protein